MSASKGLMQAASGVSTGPGAGNAWDVSTAQWLPENLNYIFIQEAGPYQAVFKTDGTKLYVTGISGDRVYQYDLSTAWDIATASFIQSLDVSTQNTAPTGLFFKTDGTKMYLTGANEDEIEEYDLSTAWDISSASYLQNFDVSLQNTNPRGMYFRQDGLKMYQIDGSDDDVKEYTLSTAWDITSASFVQAFSVSSQQTTPFGVFFKPDGNKMYIAGSNPDGVIEYDLSTAWDISSASFNQTLSLSDLGGTHTSVFFKNDGTVMYTSRDAITNANFVYQYQLSTAWDISSASYTEPTKYFDVSSQETSPTSLFFKPDGNKMYVLGNAGNNVGEYDLSTSWDISSALFSQSFSVASQEGTPRGLFFKPDGTKMYVLGSGGADVFEYNLSTAWDVSSASYLQEFYMGAQDSQPQSVFFKPDGTKMFIVGFTNDNMYEYDLSTAWDITSASFSQSFSVASQDDLALGAFFKPDGAKFYIVGASSDTVYEYDLSTAWDISSASYLQNFSVASQDTSPNGIFFKQDGLKMYMCGTTTDSIYEYDL